MSFKYLQIEITGPLAVVTINRPVVRNALSPEVFIELRQFLTAVRDGAHRALRGLVLTGAGDKAFVAGADISRMAGMTAAEGEQFAALAQEVTELLEATPIPVIACVNGFALGGGCELAMSCDFILAVKQATFGQPEVNLGLIPGFGGCVRLMRLVGPGRAKEMIYTGRMISAVEAEKIGLVNAVFDDREAMMAAAAAAVDLIAQKSASAVALCKLAINGQYGLTTHEGLIAERNAFRKAFESEDKAKGVEAFLGKLKPSFSSHPGRLG